MVGVDHRRLRPARDDDEVAVPRRELLELGEHLLALGAALHALDALLGLLRAQVEPLDDGLLRLLRRCAAQADRLEQRARRLGGVEGRVGYGPRAAAMIAERRARTAGSIRRAARSRRPAGDAGDRRRLVLGELRCRSSSQPRTARSERRRNGTSWQRERIVSGIGPSSSATSTIVA